MPTTDAAWLWLPSATHASPAGAVGNKIIFCLPPVTTNFLQLKSSLGRPGTNTKLWKQSLLPRETERGMGIALVLQKNDFSCFAKVYYHTVMLSPVPLMNSAATLISEFYGTKRVESSANLMSLLLLDNKFKYCDKTRNNVRPTSEPCTKPRLNDSNSETVPLKRQTC